MTTIREQANKSMTRDDGYQLQRLVHPHTSIDMDVWANTLQHGGTVDITFYRKTAGLVVAQKFSL